MMDCAESKNGNHRCINFWARRIREIRSFGLDRESRESSFKSDWEREIDSIIPIRHVKGAGNTRSLFARTIHGKLGDRDEVNYGFLCG